MSEAPNQPFTTILGEPTQTGDELATELVALGIPFVTGGNYATPAKLRPSALLVGLALSEEARLRLALIPLLLKRPDFSSFASTAAAILAQPVRINFQCYYTAAQLLQRKFLTRLQQLLGQQPALPDLFSAELALQSYKYVDEGLHALAQRQAQLSGEWINWLGTYEHAAQRFMIHLEKQKRWHT